MESKLNNMNNNKLIAEFMGLTNHHNDNSIMLRETPKGNVVVHVYDLDYDSSWDWLMPVVQKIGDEYLNTPFDETYSHLTEQYENIWTLEDTYKAVVEFIKGEGVVDIYAQYSFYIERCVDEVEGEIALSFEEWKQLNN